MLTIDIAPGTVPGCEPPRVALVTGACGFLGRYVVRELLATTTMRLCCLVRPKRGLSATARLEQLLAGLGVDAACVLARVEVIEGDVTGEHLGLSAAEHAALAGSVDVIYHCAAQVDWVHGYARLAPVNVGGVESVIRLACQARRKRIVFVSSISVCYAQGSPAHIDEDTNMLPSLEGMPLGYARSKCVAESLLRQAAARGLPVTVLRPALISGATASGESAEQDIIAALIEGCVRTGKAIDVDWRFDSVPVDYVAQVMVRVDQSQSNWQVLHLVHEHPRHWREVVLWMNLHGYPVTLVEEDTWAREMFEQQQARGTLLFVQRQFFCGRDKPYRIYLADAQNRIDSRRTRERLAALGLQEAPLSTELLHGYFDFYRRIALIPPPTRPGERAVSLEQLICVAKAQGRIPADGRWQVLDTKRIGAEDGLLSELAAARVRGVVGPCRLMVRDLCSQPGREPQPVILKVKVNGQLLQELAQDLASACRPELGRLFGLHGDVFGLAGSHERELMLYELDEPRLRRHMPGCYGTLRAPELQRWAVLLEYLPQAQSGSAHLLAGAGDAGMQAVLRGLSSIHATWYGADESLARLPGLWPMPETARMVQLQPLWSELAGFAATWLQDWCGPGILQLQQQIIGDLPDWWPHMAGMPRTLIHNDFNPRNLVLRLNGADPQLCAYDWELAGVGLPQQDLAELLCFVWPQDLAAPEFHALLEQYRRQLSADSGRPIPVAQWREGFNLALRHLLINRLALYTLMHRFRPLEYLPRVMRNWMRLYRWSLPKSRVGKPAGARAAVRQSAGQYGANPVP